MASESPISTSASVHTASDDEQPGSAHGRFTKAIRNRNLPNAEMAAREIGKLLLLDALAFCLLLADVDPPCFDRAIPRWHARFVLAAHGITATEASLALSAAQG